MQFASIAVTVMVVAVSAVATVPLYVRSANGSAMATGVVPPSIASTGVITAPNSTGSPIASAKGDASVHGVSGLAAIIAGGVALLL